MLLLAKIRRPCAVVMQSMLLLCFCLQTQAADGALGVPGVKGGVVATSEPLAAAAGAAMLRSGGNAVDAAAVVQFVLSVVEPQSSGIGGGGFMMIHLAKEDRTVIIDSRETAPAAATPDMFVGQKFSVRSSSGYAVGVPGTVAGVKAALDKFGTRSLSDTLAPAIELAGQGFSVSSRLADSVTHKRLDVEPGVAAYDVARNVFRPGGNALVEGDWLVQPKLASALKLIASGGVDAFYKGEIAQAIVTAQTATRSDNPAGAGRMTLSDLAGYAVAMREPIEGTYRGHRVLSMPPPSSGGLTVLQILKLVERFPLGDAGAGYGFGSPRTLNVMIEAMRLAFADRAVWMGDHDFVKVPMIGLLHDDYVSSRSALITPDARIDDVTPGDPLPFDPDIKTELMKVAAIDGVDVEGLNTTHFTIADAQGNVVTYTSTIESAWGTGLMVPEFGFMLNNELTDFNGEPKANPDPLAFDPGANDIAPGKRPRSSMAPTMLFSNEGPVAAFGSPGGSTIIDTVTHIVVNLIDHQMVIQEAVDAPRFAQTSANGKLRVEHGIHRGALESLLALGHAISEPRALGSVQAIVVDGARLYGAADKRRTGAVVSIK